MNDILKELLTEHATITEFNKERWTVAMRKLIKEQHITHKHLRAVLDCSEKTLGFYLNPKRPEIPKVPALTKLYQYLNTSAEYALIQEGPRRVDHRTNHRLQNIMEQLVNPAEPSLRVLLHLLTTDTNEEELRELTKVFIAFKKLPDLRREKILYSLLNLID